MQAAGQGDQRRGALDAGDRHRLQMLELAPADTAVQLHHPLQTLYLVPHNFAAQPHQAVHPHAQINVFSSEYQLAGEADFLFVYNGLVCAVMELKTFWKVTAESINDVLLGSSPVIFE